jgi:hypothetical protein
LGVARPFDRRDPVGPEDARLIAVERQRLDVTLNVLPGRLEYEGVDSSVNRAGLRIDQWCDCPRT